MALDDRTPQHLARQAADVLARFEGYLDTHAARPVLPPAVAYGVDSIPELVALLRDESWKTRNAAVNGLIALGEFATDAVDPLAEDEDLKVRVAAVQVLEGIGQPEG